MKKLIAILLSVALIGTMGLTTTVQAAPELGTDSQAVEVTSSVALDHESLTGFGVASEQCQQEVQMATFSTRAVAAEGSCGTNLTWKVEDGVLKIAGTGAMTNYNVGTAPWTAHASGITSIVIGSGVTEIGTYAFCDLANLTSVTVPDTVKTIKSGAFFRCSGLTGVSLPSSVTTLGDGVFSNCISLATFSASGLKTVGEYAFESTALTTFTVPKNLTSLSAMAFYNCNMKSFAVESGNTVYSVKDGALYADGGKTLFAYPGKTGEKTVTVPDGVTTIGKLAFYNCNGLESVTLPKSVTYVHPLAFLETTTVACGNTTLKNFALNGYAELQEVGVSVVDNYDMAYKMLELVNAERKAAGLSALVMNQSLMTSAMERAGEITLLFDHTRPDGTSCFTISERVFAENIAINGMYDAEGDPIADQDKNIMEALMASEGHKANILSADTTNVGIGCVEHNGYYYWVQCFGNTGDTTNCTKPANKSADHNILLTLESFGRASSRLSDIYDVKEGSFFFEPVLSVENKKNENGKSAVARVYIINPGYQLISAELNTTGIKWSSSNTSVATIAADGTLKNVANGSTTLTAKMEYHTLTTKYLLGVSRIYGASRYETAFATANTLKKTMGVDKFDAVVVATGENYADALSGSYLAYVKKAPILLVNASNETTVKNYIKANVKAGGSVYILGGTAAVSANMETGLSGYKVHRLSGKSRYETNLEILQAAGANGGELLVCTGENYADSLSASATGKPILLVKGETLTTAQKTYVKNLAAEDIYIIGGSAAVTTQMETALGSYGTTTRISGANRYATSIKVANEFFAAPSAAVLAYSQNFPDGLCGGPLAAELNSPLILTATDNEAVAAYYTDFFGINSGMVLGGSKLISDDAVRKIFDMSTSDQIVAVKK